MHIVFENNGFVYFSVDLNQHARVIMNSYTIKVIYSYGTKLTWFNLNNLKTSYKCQARQYVQLAMSFLTNTFIHHHHYLHSCPYRTMWSRHIISGFTNSLYQPSLIYSLPLYTCSLLYNSFILRKLWGSASRANGSAFDLL